MVAEQKILVVDDDDAIRSMVERVLTREKFEVESARDGCEAIEKLANNEYGTVLLDLMMPRVDGHGVLRYLEKEQPESAPKVIVMTADLLGAMSARDVPPVVEVIAKPFDIATLVSRVREALAVTPP